MGSVICNCHVLHISSCDTIRKMHFLLIELSNPSFLEPLGNTLSIRFRQSEQKEYLLRNTVQVLSPGSTIKDSAMGGVAVALKEQGSLLSCQGRQSRPTGTYW